jgi:hypothetical protein
VLWVVIAINTAVGALSIEVTVEQLILLWGVGGILGVIAGWASQRFRVGAEIFDTTFDIEGKQTWYKQLSLAAPTYAKWINSPMEDIENAIEKAKKDLGL